MIEDVSLEGERRQAWILRAHLTHPAAREALIEALTHVDVDELQVAIQTMQNDKQSRFLPMLDNSVCSPLMN